MNVTVPDFTKYPDFAAETIGGKILFATDDFFGVCENVILDNDPIFIADKYTEYGKWMDGWETRRKRIPGHDWCLIKLATLCFIRGILVDTAFFIGNYAPRYSIQGAHLTRDEEKLLPPRISQLGSMSSSKNLKQTELLNSKEWTTIVPMTALAPGNKETRYNFKDVSNNISAISHIRVNIYPDGGIARLKIFGEPSLNKPPPTETIDLMSVINGAKCEGYSNAQFGHPRNIIKPNKSATMADGWETARRIDRPPVIEINRNGTINSPGEEWAVFKLAFKGVIKTVHIDTAYFKGNYPDTIKIEGTTLNNSWSPKQKNIVWKTILPTKKLGPDREVQFKVKSMPCTHIKVSIAPDGGISRIRAFGFVPFEQD